MQSLDFNEAVLWEHQQASYDRAKNLDEFSLLGDPGTGKTLTIIKVLRYKYSLAKEISPTLIVTPLITLENWFDEWMKFSRIKADKILVLKGPMKKRIITIEKAVEKYGRNIILITNYDAIASVHKNFYEYLLREFEPEILICDESHRVKTHNSQVTKRLIKLTEKTKCRYLMTGTFITNGAFDVWAQYRILDKGKSFGTNFYNFRNKYFHDENYGMPKRTYFPNFILNDGALEEINKLVNAKASRDKKEDCIDLPKLIKKQVFIDMTPEQSKHYTEMKKELITYINGDAVTAKMALVKSLRLQQIVTGHMKTEKGDIVTIKNNRRKALKELLEDLCPKQKVIIWAVFHANYNDIRGVCDELKLKYVEGHGQVSEKAKFKNIRDFNDDSSINVFIGHPKSIGVGINLKKAGVSIRYSRTFSYEEQEQSRARNYRGGSIDYHDKIYEINIICRDSIDHQIVKALENKHLTSEQILGILKNSI